MNTRARRQVGCVARSAVILVLAVVAFSAVAESTASAKTWYLTISPARVERGGNVAIETTNHAKCRVTLRVSGYVFHYTMRGGQKLLAIPRTETPGRWRVRVDCGRTHAINSFTVLNSVLGARTPITVANVCALDPALGTVDRRRSPGIRLPTGGAVRGACLLATRSTATRRWTCSPVLRRIALRGALVRWLTARSTSSPGTREYSSARPAVRLPAEEQSTSICEEARLVHAARRQECPATRSDCYYEDTDDGS